MKILIDINTGYCVGFGNADNWPYTVPVGLNINSENYNTWKCNDISNYTDIVNWSQTAPPLTDPTEIKKRDIDFGNALLLEFLTGQKDLSLDNATYTAVTDTFRYAELALKRGDLVQARTYLSAIAPIAPLWTTEIKTHYINKLTNYIGY